MKLKQMQQTCVNLVVGSNFVCLNQVIKRQGRATADSLLKPRVITQHWYIADKQAYLHDPLLDNREKKTNWMLNVS